MACEGWIHSLALCESDSVGSGTKVWAFSHVMKGAVIGRDCNIGEHVFIESGVVVGDRVTIKNGVQLWEGVAVEEDVFIGPNAVFTNDRFPRSPRSNVGKARYADKAWLEKARVCRGATIGANATILPGVEIGCYATIGAGAVVARSAGPHALMKGSPARRVGWVCQCGRKMDANILSRECRYCGAHVTVEGHE